MKKTILFSFFLTSYFFSFAQLQIDWQKCLGGTGYENGYCVAQTSDHGFVVAGASRSNDGDVSGHYGLSGTSDYWIVKLDSGSNIQWERSLGGNDFDIAYSVVQAPDGGFVIAGYSQSLDGDVTGNHGGMDYWIVKLDVNGNLLWQKSFGGGFNEIAYDVIVTDDSCYVIAGFSSSNDGDVIANHGSSDYWILKLDSTGNILWQKCYGGTDGETASSIIQTKDGGYAIAGYAGSHDGDVTGTHGWTYDYWVVKTDGNGNLEWQKTLGGTFQDWAYSIVQDEKGGFCVAGWSVSNDGDISQHHGSIDYSDYWIVRLDSSGNLSWENSLGGTADENAYAIENTPDSGYIVAGFTSSTDGDVTGYLGIWDYWLTKLDSNGLLLWQKCYGGTGSEFCYSMTSTIDGGYAVMGSTASNDIDVSGNHTTGGNGDYWVVKFLPDSSTTNIAESPINISGFEFTLSPNPVKGTITLSDLNTPVQTIELFDIYGKKLHVFTDYYHKTVDCRLLPPGIYILQASNGEKVWRGKFIKE